MLKRLGVLLMIFRVVMYVTLLLPVVAAAGLLEEGFEASYSVSRNAMDIGLSERQLTRDGQGALVYSSRTYAQGLLALLAGDVITERSVITERNGQLQPLRYSYERRGGRKDRRYQLQFDWRARTLHSDFDGRSQRLALDGPTHDLLSFQLRLMRALQRGQSSLTLQIARKAKLESYQLRVTGTESIDTALGRFTAVRVEQQSGPRSGKDFRFTFWCVAELGYLPVRIRREEQGGEVYLSELRKLQRTGTAAVALRTTADVYTVAGAD
ncbi:MAG: DUF3108 domain-containing protein [Pseudomonadota bacterium]|nr:MAG: DUF3108 domain-containing protein [Pseudomonadota bacterium]